MGDTTGAIKVPHRSQFEPNVVKQQLGITVSSWYGFVARMKALVDCPVYLDSVEGLLRRVLTYPALIHRDAARIADASSGSRLGAAAGCKPGSGRS